jgi:hypothetical protein
VSSTTVLDFPRAVSGVEAVSFDPAGGSACRTTLLLNASRRTCDLLAPGYKGAAAWLNSVVGEGLAPREATLKRGPFF